MKQVVIIGGGPSLREFDFKFLNNKFTIGLNYACRFHEPTAIVWVDKTFYSEEQKYLLQSKAVLIARDSCHTPSNVIKLPDSRHKYYGLTGLRDGLYSSYMVGLFALSMCVALRIEEIYLLGYDCKFFDGKSHFHDVEHRGTKSEEPYYKSIRMYDVYKNCESKIFNVSDISLIEVFQKISFDDFFNRVEDVDQEFARKWLVDKINEYKS